MQALFVEPRFNTRAGSAPMAARLRTDEKMYCLMETAAISRYAAGLTGEKAKRVISSEQ
jgi:hypothetical protein